MESLKCKLALTMLTIMQFSPPAYSFSFASFILFNCIYNCFVAFHSFLLILLLWYFLFTSFFPQSSRLILLVLIFFFFHLSSLYPSFVTFTPKYSHLFILSHFLHSFSCFLYSFPFSISYWSLKLIQELLRLSAWEMKLMS